ncbi:MAG: peptide chain release factor N(5)-glutamine methyltransferase [Desulfuromonadaceae bacterium]|nr:peptide chain release factor N(5)-glutamine methyltransferase [Desulfuromonadaceae bacterium]MDD5105019.1 peptide chain release factor N(5)-glutamine methyltransferase [Desulfuromonadaceae bacterium]
MATEEQWTVLRILRWTKDYLLSKGVENARLEAEWLLCAVTGLDRVGLYLAYDKPLNERELSEYRALISRRAKREPLQHILKSQEFMGREYEVSADVLIPRYDTEVLVNEAQKNAPHAREILEIGTGSGCIAISLQHYFTAANVTATDISAAALAVAQRNALKHGATISFVLGSLFVPVADRIFDLIVSNPPYIPTADIATLDPEVKGYDPIIALDGGVDGLDFYRRLIPGAVPYLNNEGWLIVEIGIEQSAAVIGLFKQTGCYDEPVVARDDGGIERVVGGRITRSW